MNDQREITVQDASLQTATISIRVLQVNNKQMTLAVFRQLPDCPLVAPWGLEGTLWGWVNYHPDCSLKYSHYHVIWASDGHIYKDTVIGHLGHAASAFLEDAGYRVSNHENPEDGECWYPKYRGGGRIPKDSNDRRTITDLITRYQASVLEARRQINDAGQLFIAV